MLFTIVFINLSLDFNLSQVWCHINEVIFVSALCNRFLAQELEDVVYCAKLRAIGCTESTSIVSINRKIYLPILSYSSIFRINLSSNSGLGLMTF